MSDPWDYPVKIHLKYRIRSNTDVTRVIIELKHGNESNVSHFNIFRC